MLSIQSVLTGAFNFWAILFLFLKLIKPLIAAAGVDKARHALAQAVAGPVPVGLGGGLGGAGERARGEVGPLGLKPASR